MWAHILNRGKKDMVSYSELKKTYKNVVEFCLKKLELLDNYKSKIPSNSLQKIAEAKITTESSPYFCIIKFYYDGFTAFKFEKSFDIIIVHKSDNQTSYEYLSDTVISAHFTNNMLVELEVYNVDSSIIDWDNLLTGETTVMDSLT